ncbi:MAG: hypothetical protein V4558_05050 [Gemmatimonadota bacterium]
MRCPLPMVLLLAAACNSAGAKVALNVPAIDTLPGGIVRVRNSGPTEWADTSGWKLVLEHTFTMADGSPGQLNDPGAIVVDSKGNFYILDQKPATIKAYGSDGAFLRTIGKDGSGPGEFRQWGLLMIAHDTLVEHDPRQSRTSLFTTDGQFIRVWLTLCCHSRPVSADDNGLISIPGSIKIDTTAGRKSLFAGAGFVRFRLDSTVADTVLFPTEPVRKLWEFHNKQNNSSWSIPFTAGTSSRLDRAGRFVWADQENYRFIISKTGLDTTRIFESVPGPVATIPDSLRKEQFDSYTKGNPDLRGIAKMADIPTVYPAWTTFVVDGANNLWVLLPGAKGPGTFWDVFTADGTLLGRVPATFSEPWRTFWTRDHVYSVEDDESTGSTAIKVYRIDKGGKR